MKTNFKISVLLIAIFILTNLISQAQTFYTIRNALNCSVTFSINVYNGGSCSNLCNSYSPSVSANSTYNIPSGVCGVICNIEVYVIDIGGTPPTGNPMVDFTTTSTGCSGGGCSSSILEYISGGLVFKVY